MIMYLYRLQDCDCEDDEYNENAHLVETKLTSVLPMVYGYFDIGWDYIDIYPYHTATFPSKPITILNEQEHESNGSYAMLMPYQNKAIAKDIFSRWLKCYGYDKAAKAVKRNPITHLRRTSSPPTKEDVSYAKRWDKIKTSEINDKKYHAIACE